MIHSLLLVAAAQRKLAIADAKMVESDLSNDNTPASKSVENPLFDMAGMSDAVAHANGITSAYGVEICSINIISANPDDPSLTSSLSTGAVASAAALQAETSARGRAKAMKIEAEAMAITMEINSNAEAQSALVAAETYAKSTTIKAEAEGKAEILKAEGTKQAEILRAEGAIKAALLLEESNVAVDLERIKQSALALNGTDKFFFGKEPEYMSNIVMNAGQKSATTSQNMLS